ncbi:hypothetical protein Salat_2729700 [Sesamum alatum]|uniref:DUF4283 domain-containing protein n=1 Tax=Sesamum alatum TaxID=300844 RepID=A0AAE1XKN1_9LAMI|nr:hypothetical protein Salat_2729700 [Sesamum alatum]
MGKVLSLMDEEVADFTIPQATWDRGSGGSHLTLVGSLISHRSVHFEAMKGSLVHLIQASRGVSFRKVSDSRFCLVFNHVEDLRRVLDMWPWIFDRNLIVFQQLSPKEDPLSLNLDWCPFFVHVHDIPYGLRTIDVIRCLGSSLDSWLDDSHIEQHGEVVVVRFSYKRLPNFCYLCGKVGTLVDFVTYTFRRTLLIYDAWLRAAGPLRRLGVALDALRPTYVQHFQLVTDSSIPVQLGARIFGEFGSKNKSAEALALPAGGIHVTSPLLREQLRDPLQQLCKDKAIICRQLLDEQSAADVSNFAGQIGHGYSSGQAQFEPLHCPHNWAGPDAGAAQACG